LTLIYSEQTEIGKPMRNALRQFVACHTGNACGRPKNDQTLLIQIWIASIKG